MTTGQVRRKGRPPKSDKGPATTSISMRVRPEVYEDIRRDAEKQGRSVAAQAERRVAYPEPEATDAARMIGLAIAAVEQRAGSSWSDNEAVKIQCRAAADFALTMIFGYSTNIERLRSALETQLEIYNRPYTGVAAINNPTSEDIAVMYQTMQNWLDGMKIAETTFASVLRPTS